MALQTILGQKLEQTQKFLEDGTRIPVTRIFVAGNVVTGLRTVDKHNYSSVQLGFGKRSKATKSLIGNVKGASLTQAPKFLKEVRMAEDSDMQLGAVVNPSEVLAEGDIINITGVSKGKGYAGVVKRHGFAGGPKTHGQSDRHRAPGAIGQGTTPGRVYRGKRMAGRMGHENVTIRNLVVVGVTEDEVWVKGLIPGSLNSMVIVKKVGTNKKFVPLFKEKVDEPVVEESVEEVKAEVSGETPQPTPEGNVQESESTDLSVSNDAQQEDVKQTEDSASLSDAVQSSSEQKTEENTEAGVSSSENEQTSDSVDNNKEENKEEVKEDKKDAS